MFTKSNEKSNFNHNNEVDDDDSTINDDPNLIDLAPNHGGPVVILVNSTEKKIQKQIIEEENDYMDESIHLINLLYIIYDNKQPIFVEFFNFLNF